MVLRNRSMGPMLTYKIYNGCKCISGDIVLTRVRYIVSNK